MTKNYLPTQATTEQACEWLESQTGERWTLGRLLEHGLTPWFWLDYSPGWPDALFGGRAEGYQAPVVFSGDIQRLEAVGRDVLVNITRTHDRTLMKIGPPGLRMSVDELRFKREDIEALRKALANQPEGAWPTQSPVTNDRLTSEGAGANPLKTHQDNRQTQQDNRLTQLRSSGGNVVLKNGKLHVKGITELVKREADARTLARSEKTIRADLKAAYEREVEEKRGGHFDGLRSR